MATDEEIIQLWNSFPKKMKEDDAIIRLYRLAEDTGKKESSLSIEKELVSDSTIETAIKTLGWGRNNKASIVAQKAVLRQVLRIAMEKVKKSPID